MPTNGTRSGGVLQALYDHEINASIEAFYDGGFRARLGDDLNGWLVEETLPSMMDAEAWLDSAARERHPVGSKAL